MAHQTTFTRQSFWNFIEQIRYHRNQKIEDGFTFKISDAKNYAKAKFVYRESVDNGKAIFAIFPPEHTVRFFVSNGDLYDLFWKINDLANY